MKYLTLVLLASMALSRMVSANDDVKLIVERRKVSESKDRYEHAKVEEKIIAFNVTASSRQEFKNLTVKYNIFWEDAHLGDTAKSDFITTIGKHEIEKLPKQMPVKFQTKSLSLQIITWDSNYPYKSGAIQVRDKVLGIWFKVFTPDGKQVGEYIDPMSVPTEQKWQD